MQAKNCCSGILSRFGKVSLIRARYRRGRRGRTIFPLEILLGIEAGFTPAAASRVGQQFAACGSSQGRTLEMIADRMGTKIGTEKLRRLVATLAGAMEPYGQKARVEKSSSATLKVTRSLNRQRCGGTSDNDCRCVEIWQG